MTVSCKSLFMVFCRDEVLFHGNGPNTSNLSKMAANLNELLGDICEESLWETFKNICEVFRLCCVWHMDILYGKDSKESIFKSFAIPH